MSQKKKKTIEDLNKLYSESTTADQELFAEQRSNTLLVSGNHYSGKGAKNWDRIRDARDVPSDIKIRLTKNHISKISKTYLNNLLSSSPGVQVTPRNERETQDRKCAELNNAVWQYGKDTLKFSSRIIELGKDFIDLGETAVKVFWNPNAGKFLGYHQAIDENGQPAVDENGQPAPDLGSPSFQGKLEIEKILPTNLLRDANCTVMDESPWLGIRKMLPIEDAKALVGDDQEKLKMIQPSQRDQFMVFDSNTSNYNTVKGQVMLIEYYFRPCSEYPNGYFYITTKAGILFEGELPFGVFPICYAGFDSIQTTPRHRSIIKQLRPYQIEINRTASKIAEAQTTSDDKLLIQNGTKIASGGVLPGVRAIQYSGQAPTVLEGRTGNQYIEYMNGQISEMYNVANLSEDNERKDPPGTDLYGLLFRSVKDQKKFSIYAEKFEIFLVEICKVYLALAKQYFTDDMLVPQIGKAEYVNISEFRNSEDIRHQIKVEPMSEDANSMFGRWLAINHAIQYAGSSLSKEDIGRLMRNVPYGNFEESFSDLTMDYDTGTNYILSLERGKWVEPQAGANKTYMLKRLEKRMLDSDFQFLDPQIQMMFQKASEGFKQMEIDEKLAIQRAEQGFIPTGGPLIKTDLQIQEPNTTGGMKTTRAAFPVEALSWLQKQLQVQGSNLQDLSSLPQAAQAGLARQFNDQSQVQNQVDPNSGQTITQHASTPMQGAENGTGQPRQF